MHQYKQLKLTHANLHKELFLILGTVAGYHYSDATASTNVYTTAGIFPAKESPEEITGLIDQLTQGEENERTTK